MDSFCLDCRNIINETEDSPKKYIISKDLDLCEGCGELKPVIVSERKFYCLNKLLCRLLMPYFVYKYKIKYKKRLSAIILHFAVKKRERFALSFCSGSVQLSRAASRQVS